jgi:hypothetical protein
LEPDLLLHPRDIADRGILDLPQLCGRNPPSSMLFPRPQQFRRPQQASDVIGAKRRTRHGIHPDLPILSFFDTVDHTPDDRPMPRIEGSGCPQRFTRTSRGVKLADLLSGEIP